MQVPEFGRSSRPGPEVKVVEQAFRRDRAEPSEKCSEMRRDGCKRPPGLRYFDDVLAVEFGVIKGSSAPNIHNRPFNPKPSPPQTLAPSRSRRGASKRR